MEAAWWRWHVLASSFLLVFISVGYANGACEAGWSNQNNNCYLAVVQNQSWVAARQWCITHNAELVNIMSAVENKLVVQIASGLLGRTSSYWIGLNDMQTQGQYSWSTGNTLVYNNWRSGEPNNPLDEDCVEMDDSSYWNDQGCSTQRSFICKKPFSTPLPTITIPGKYTIATDKSCGGWYLNKGICYQYFSAPSQWAAAQASCFSMGGYLLDILTSDELAYVKALVYNQRTNIQNFFIGLNDRLNESSYVWDDGTRQGHPLATTYWATGEPNDYHNLEDCAEMTTHPNYHWNDLTCTAKRPYMCKRLVSAANASGYWPPLIPSLTKCPRGYTMFNHPNGAVYCYALKGRLSTWRLTWTAAQKACARTGPGFALASIHDHYEQNKLTAMIKASYSRYRTTTYWFGLNDRTREGGYINSDGTATDYIRWGGGQPNNLQGRQDCVAIFSMYSGNWNDDNCNTHHAYICKYTLKPRPLPSGGVPQVSDKYCANGWHQFGSYCYLVKTQATDLVTHSVAVSNCAQLYKANMTSVHSVAEHGYLMSIIGLHNASTRVHIGINDMKVEGEFQWSDGTLVDFTNWGYNQPNDWRNSQDCTELDHHLGYWNDINCKTDKRGYVCKRLRDQPTQPISQITQCTSGWTWFNNFCYQIPAVNATAAAAQAYCAGYSNPSNLKGSLVTIRSRYDNFFLSSMIASQPNVQRAYFIGINDVANEGTYTWWSGMPVTYSNWAPHEPNQWQGNEDCTEIYSSTYKWNDRLCNRTQSFICMVPDNKQTTLPTVKPQLHGLPSATCPKGWQKYGSSNMCYGFFGSIHTLTMMMDTPLISPKAWTDANMQCQAMGAQLVSIHDAATNQYLMDQTQKYKMGWWSFWTGLNDRNQEGGYVWSDTTGVQYTAWATQEPNDWRGTEDCVEVMLDKARKGWQFKWNDQGCTSKRPYVCAFPAGIQYTAPTSTPLSLPPGTTVLPSCPSGWTQSPTSCYKPVVQQTLTWTAADLKCRSMSNVASLANGKQPHLASVHTPQDHVTLAKVTSLAAATAGLPLNSSTNFWIGLQDRTKENNFTWSDMSSVDYTAWSSGQPNNLANSQDCVEMRVDTGYLWNDLQCSATRQYVCSFSRFVMKSSKPSLPAAAQNESCNPMWKKYGLSCYRMFSAVRVDYDTAYINCSAQGGDLYIANTKKEDQFVLGNIASGSAYVWIGLSDADREGYYRWADGSYLQYTNWGPSQPNNYNNEDCVALHSEDDRWYDRSCDEPHAFICEVPLFSMNFTSPTGSSGQQGGSNHTKTNYHVSKGLSGGAIAGIVISVIVFIAIIAAVVYFGDFTKGFKGLPRRSNDSYSPAPINSGDDEDDDAMLVAE
eukprot:scpid20721/ scgid10588/ Macrophage mannose receptor 1; C-type lectin domain family 13 member D; C-type lectin domain family 13 member D-like; Macrophage mannose receptor 1-like protein 1